MYTHFVRTYGTNHYLIDNYISDSYTKITNDVGLAVVTVPASHPAVTGLQLDDQFEIWRGNPHPATSNFHYMDWRGFFRGVTYRTLEDGLEVADLFAWHENEILRRSIVAYPSGIEGVTLFSATSASNIMSVLVIDNFAGKTTSLIGSVARNVQATTKNVINGTFAVPSSLLSDYDVANRNVLSVWQELADLDKAVFVVIKDVGAETWRVNLSRTTFATDRRNTVTFDARRENLANLELDRRTIGETTVALVGGPGDGVTRPYTVVTSAARNIATNSYEGFYDGYHLDTAGARQAYGNANLNRTTARPAIRLQPVQLPTFNYGKQYFWGDIVTVRYGSQAHIQRITEVACSYNPSIGETIQLGFEQLP